MGKTEQIMVRMEPELMAKLRELAALEERTVSQVVRMAVMRHVALSPQALSPGYASASDVDAGLRAVAEMVAPAAKSPCSHSPVLVRNGRCTECGEVKP